MLTDNHHLIRAGSIALTLFFAAPCVFVRADARATAPDVISVASPLAVT